ncbi:hypothetical protein PINS_up010692 [Pythium insidiosum]|nr:hypothetical protein PINS_up010692 [Pythium insidiosum]
MSDDSASTSEGDVQETQRDETVGVVELAVSSDEQKPSNGSVEEETSCDTEPVTPSDGCVASDAKKDVDAFPLDASVRDVEDATQTEKNASAQAGSSSSSSDSSSSSGSSSSSSDSSDDSDVEDVTDQFRQSNDAEVTEEFMAGKRQKLENAAGNQPTKETVVMFDSEDEPNVKTSMNNDQGHDEPMKKIEEPEEEEDGMAEQWFHGQDAEPEGVEIEAIVVSHVEEEDVFLLPPEAVSPRKQHDVLSVPASTSATKRRRPEDSSDEDDVEASPGEVTTSSSEADVSDVEVSSFARERRKPKRPKPDDSVMDIPSEYNVFENIAPDDHEFPHLKGTYSFKGVHRATFAGHWGFTEADFTSDREGAVSKFEYSSGYIPYTRRGSSAVRPPHSGKYTGYFNLRQFSGKIVKIREDHVEFKFMRLARQGDEDLDSDDSDDDAQAPSGYRVIGRGKNKFGRFLVHGYYNGATGRMSLRRRYLE